MEGLNLDEISFKNLVDVINNFFKIKYGQELEYDNINLESDLNIFNNFLINLEDDTEFDKKFKFKFFSWLDGKSISLHQLKKEMIEYPELNDIFIKSVDELIEMYKIKKSRCALYDVALDKLNESNKIDKKIEEILKKINEKDFLNNPENIAIVIDCLQDKLFQDKIQKYIKEKLKFKTEENIYLDRDSISKLFDIIMKLIIGDKYIIDPKIKIGINYYIKTIFDSSKFLKSITGDLNNTYIYTKSIYNQLLELSNGLDGLNTELIDYIIRFNADFGLKDELIIQLDKLKAGLDKQENKVDYIKKKKRKIFNLLLENTIMVLKKSILTDVDVKYYIVKTLPNEINILDKYKNINFEEFFKLPVIYYEKLLKLKIQGCIYFLLNIRRYQSTFTSLKEYENKYVNNDYITELEGKTFKEILNSIFENKEKILKTFKYDVIIKDFPFINEFIPDIEKYIGMVLNNNTKFILIKMIEAINNLKKKKMSMRK